MLRSVASSLTLVLTVAACSDATTAGPTPEPQITASRGGVGSGATRTRNLAGRCATTFTFAPPTGPAQQLHIDGKCTFAPLGRLALSSEQTVIFNLDGTSTITNTSTYTAPNGDQLFATFLGTGSAPDASGNVCFSGTETYSGGTGRFEGASGSAAVQGCASLPQGTGSFVARGTIRY
jgi:hypothetical protein